MLKDIISGYKSMQRHMDKVESILLKINPANLAEDSEWIEEKKAHSELIRKGSRVFLLSAGAYYITHPNRVIDYVHSLQEGLCFVGDEIKDTKR